MFSLRALSILLPVAAVFASPAPKPQNLPSSRSTSYCTTGELNCCKTIITSDQPAYQSIVFSLLPTALQDISEPLALGCSPLGAVGAVAGGTCSAQPTCCEEYSSNGIGVNCSPFEV